MRVFPMKSRLMCRSIKNLLFREKKKMKPHHKYLLAVYYKIQFDATNLLSAVYFCSLRAGNKQFVHKAILVK